MYKVDNAVIMAAGTSSRFAPLSHEVPKALITVKGEVLIERQIRQLREAGIDEVYVVTGYKAEAFEYLKEKCGVRLVHNPDFLKRNNNGSIWAVKAVLKNTYVCSADNYFAENPFESYVDGSYYAAVYANGHTDEWCLEEDEGGFIKRVTVGGSDAWYMLGHTFWDEEFSREFVRILEDEYTLPKTAGLLWESIFSAHLGTLKMKLQKYPDGVIYEFDTLDELRTFDESYVKDTRSPILKAVSRRLCCGEDELISITALKGGTNEAEGFTFLCRGEKYAYSYGENKLRRI